MSQEKKLISIIQEISGSKFIGDDGAVLSLDSANYVFSIDNFIEGTHFNTAYFSPRDIGWKALAVNLSDLAAMAAEPLYALISIALKEDIEDKEEWIKEFYQGIQDCHSKIQVIGGDLASAKTETSIAITVIGKTNKSFARNSAKAGAKICVTGKFGNSKKEFEDLQTNPQANASRHLRPVARLKEALAIEEEQGALMDTSDGLAQALEEIAQQSQVKIQIDTSLIPRDSDVSLEQALYGGEDYELVGAFENCPRDFLVIGEVTEGSSVFDENDKEITSQNSYSHFQ